MSDSYLAPGPTRAELDAMPGTVVVEFGTDWCGHCRAAQRPIAEALADAPAVRRVKIEDGRGRPAGRSFGIKLWPTLIVLAEGREVARVVRPTEPGVVRHALLQAGSAR